MRAYKVCQRHAVQHIATLCRGTEHSPAVPCAANQLSKEGCHMTHVTVTTRPRQVTAGLAKLQRQRTLRPDSQYHMFLSRGAQTRKRPHAGKTARRKAENNTHTLLIPLISPCFFTDKATVGKSPEIFR